MTPDFVDLKLRIARSQLSVALDLFIQDRDPIAVHCLACGAAEVLDGVGRIKGVQVFSDHVNKTSNVEHNRLRRVRNQYWNAFKHVTGHDINNVRTEDIDLIGSFSDTINDDILWCGWYDYMMLRRSLPIEAQVFQCWYCAKNPNALAKASDTYCLLEMFPGITQITRCAQKQTLRNVATKYQNDKELLANSKTEPTLLDFAKQASL